MKLAYFDCPTGLAGNMILGALLDAVLDRDYLIKELHKLPITNYKLLITSSLKCGLLGKHFHIIVKADKPHRNLPEVLAIINKSRLSKRVKQQSSKIFRRLAEAEAKVHGQPVNKVHFHDVGAIDAIIDIVGACIGLEKLGIEAVYCSPLPHGKGSIIHEHGVMPNPAPAAAELLKGVPTYGTSLKGELVTPTGAAIITTLAKGFGNLPKIKLESIGHGAGTINLPQPNMVRLFIGEALLPTENDAVLQIETNIDDLDSKAWPKVIAKLMRAGALDAYITPIIMKKERQAVNLTILAEPEDKEIILEALFRLTTTFGARVYLVDREKLTRKFKKAGGSRVKLGYLGKQLITIAPEYEDYKRIAAKHHIPLAAAQKKVLKSVVRDLKNQSKG